MPVCLSPGSVWPPKFLGSAERNGPSGNVLCCARNLRLLKNRRNIWISGHFYFSLLIFLCVAPEDNVWIRRQILMVTSEGGGTLSFCLWNCFSLSKTLSDRDCFMARGWTQPSGRGRRACSCPGGRPLSSQALGWALAPCFHMASTLRGCRTQPGPPNELTGGASGGIYM